MSLRDDLDFASRLARTAGRVVLTHYGKVERQTKTHAAASSEAVTEADRATQRHIVSALRSRFPNDGIIGEENDAGDAITCEIKDCLGRNWVIDPIDGTNNFIAGLGMFCVCIGLMDKGFPVLGVVYDVTRDELYAGAQGIGATKNGSPIHATEQPMSDASVLMLTSNVLDKTGQCPKWAIRWIAQTNWKLRMLGSAALEAIQVATGVASASITVNGKLWDVAAPAAVVLAAGGCVSDLLGKDVFPFDLKGYAGAKVPYISAGPAAHPTIIAELQR